MNDTTQTMSYVGFWQRFVASLIDIIILDIILAIIIGFLNSVVSNGTLLNISEILLGWVFYAAVDSLPKQVSIGKRLVEITLTALKDYKFSFSEAIAGCFDKILSTQTLFVSLLKAGLTYAFSTKAFCSQMATEPWRGNETVKQVLPCSLTTQILPPKCSVSFFTSANPNPVPPCFQGSVLGIR